MGTQKPIGKTSICNRKWYLIQFYGVLSAPQPNICRYFSFFYLRIMAGTRRQYIQLAQNAPNTFLWAS